MVSERTSRKRHRECGQDVVGSIDQAKQQVATLIETVETKWSKYQPDMIDGEATVMVYQRRNGHVYLEPCNLNYNVIDGDKAVVLGIVVAVLRSI